MVQVGMALHEDAQHTPTAAHDGRRGTGMQLLGLAVSLAAVAAVSLIGRLWTDTTPDSWYSSLEQPSWNPPDWLFGPVWGLLYLLMAIAAWRIWRRTDRPAERRTALWVYVIQLALNLAWTGIFFGLERPGWALGEIAMLAVMIALTIVLFGRLDTSAAWMLAPYLAWVLFAGSINAGVVALN